MTLAEVSKFILGEIDVLGREGPRGGQALGGRLHEQLSGVKGGNVVIL